MAAESPFLFSSFSSRTEQPIKELDTIRRREVNSNKHQLNPVRQHLAENDHTAAAHLHHQASEILHVATHASATSDSQQTDTHAGKKITEARNVASVVTLSAVWLLEANKTKKTPRALSPLFALSQLLSPLLLRTAFSLLLHRLTAIAVTSANNGARARPLIPFHASGYVPSQTRGNSRAGCRPRLGRLRKGVVVSATPRAVTPPPPPSELMQRSQRASLEPTGTRRNRASDLQPRDLITIQRPFFSSLFYPKEIKSFLVCLFFFF